MGGSSSKSSVYQESNTFVANRSDIKVLNETINSTIVNTTIENVKNCSAALINTQKIQIIGMVAGEDITITSQQTQEGMLNFACAQKDEVRNDVAATMVNEILQQLENKVDTTVLDKLNAIADSKSKQDWGNFPWGGSDSKSDIKQIVNTKVETMTKKDLRNVVTNAVEANFTNRNYSECLAKVINNQEFVAKDLTAGRNITLTLNQDQAGKVFAQCVQNSEVANFISQNVTDFFGIKIKEDVSTTKTTDVSGEATSEAVSTGLFQGIADVFRGIGDMFGGLFSLSALGPLGSLSAPLSICCCCLIIIAIVAMFLLGEKKPEVETVTTELPQDQSGGFRWFK